MAATIFPTTLLSRFSSRSFSKNVYSNIPTRRDTRLWICNTCSVPLVSSRSSQRSTWRKKREIGVTSVSDLDASRWTWSKQQGRRADRQPGEHARLH